MFCERLSPQSSSMVSWKRSETSSWIRRIETSAASPCGKTSLSTSSASSTDSERPVRDENATTRVSAPSSSRMLVEMRVDEVVHERLARHVADRELARVLRDVLGDRLHQVCLAETGASVDEEGVVGLGGRFRHGERGGMCEAVRGTDHEQVERVLR